MFFFSDVLIFEQKKNKENLQLKISEIAIYFSWFYFIALYI